MCVRCACVFSSLLRAGGVFPLTPGGSSNKELLASTYQSLLRHHEQLGGGRAAGWRVQEKQACVCVCVRGRRQLVPVYVNEGTGEVVGAQRCMEEAQVEEGAASERIYCCFNML